MRIYLASSWRNEYQPGAVRELRAAGHDVYDFRNPPNGDPGFHWTEIDPNWRRWTAEQYRHALRTGPAERGFRNDMNGMLWADTGILLLPAGRSAHLELGWMAGAGKNTIIWTHDGEEPDLMNMLADEICTDLQEVLKVLHDLSIHRAPA